MEVSTPDSQRVSLEEGQRLFEAANAVKQFAAPCISGFYVGCCMLLEDGTAIGGFNIEFPGLPLFGTIHAEHFCIAALHNRYKLQERPRIRAIGLTAAPCGHCRQMLAELCSQGDDIDIFFNVSKKDDKVELGRFGLIKDLLQNPVRVGLLDHLLPNAASESTLAEDNQPYLAVDNESAQSEEEVCTSKLLGTFMHHAYAPFSRSKSCCVIVTPEKNRYVGGCVESVAFNPGVPPFQSSIIAFAVERLGTCKPSLAQLKAHLSRCIGASSLYDLYEDLLHVETICIGQGKDNVIDHIETIKLFRDAVCPKASLKSLKFVPPKNVGLMCTRTSKGS